MFKNVNGKKIEVSASGIAQRAIDEAAWIAGQATRDEENAKRSFSSDPDMPTLEEKVDAILEGGAKLDEVKAKVAALKIKHGRV